MPYYNFSVRTAVSGWERRSFLHNWWRIYQNDSRWTPPPYRRLRREADPAYNPHLARLNPLFAGVEAFVRSQRAAPSGTFPAALPGSFNETPLATGVLLRDRRRRDGVAHVALYHCANATESTPRLLDYFAEQAMGEGFQRLLLPVGLSPHLGSGLLRDHWSHLPPLHTPYNPPYLPELLERQLRPFLQGRLYHVDVPAGTPLEPGPVTVEPLEVPGLARDLLPLFVAATQSRAGFAPPDAEEAAFLLRWLGAGLEGWLARVDDAPVGFVLLQPDYAAHLRRARGGRRIWWRLWLRWRMGTAVGAGRILFGAVLPAWRRQGIGRQLWQRALQTARSHGWQTMTAGPVWTATPAESFLQQLGATAVQRYALYEWSM